MKTRLNAKNELSLISIGAYDNNNLNLDANETMGFVQNQVGHSSIKPIVNHYYNRIPRDEDGQRLEEALKSAQVLPDLEDE